MLARRHHVRAVYNAESAPGENVACVSRSDSGVRKQRAMEECMSFCRCMAHSKRIHAVMLPLSTAILHLGALARCSDHISCTFNARARVHSVATVAMYFTHREDAH